ncbi:MAG: DUF427 domain-containing protein [Pseudonocardiaceae bacterium]
MLVTGEPVADSVRPLLLFETHLPTRYYLPFEDVRTELLEASDTVTVCPYKGRARYWSLRVGETVVPDAAWSYPDPIPENPNPAARHRYALGCADVIWSSSARRSGPCAPRCQPRARSL